MRMKMKLHLAKQNFKFSAAHFLIFDSQNAEKLHGHNYRVQVSLSLMDSKALEEQGYLVDFHLIKRIVKSELDQWDEQVLLPFKNSEMLFQEIEGHLHVGFRDRKYVFPRNEVQCLPIQNTSVEQLSGLLLKKLFKSFEHLGVAELQVSVEETEGQGAIASYP